MLRDTFISDNPIYSKYSIGEFSYGTPKVLNPGTKSTLKIGRFCSISKNVVILLAGEHRSDWITTYPFNTHYRARDIFFNESQHFEGGPNTKGDVIIGNDVWIGINAMILSGVEIGDGAVIGASSVVAKDVPPYAIVAGNPARIIRMRFDDDIIEKLLKIRWWNWDLQRIKENMPLLLSNDVEEFVNKNYR